MGGVRLSQGMTQAREGDGPWPEGKPGPVWGEEAFLR